MSPSIPGVQHIVAKAILVVRVHQCFVKIHLYFPKMKMLFRSGPPKIAATPRIYDEACQKNAKMRILPNPTQCHPEG